MAGAVVGSGTSARAGLRIAAAAMSPRWHTTRPPAAPRLSTRGAEPARQPQLFMPGAGACRVDPLTCRNIPDRHAPIRCETDRAFPQVAGVHAEAGDGSRPAAPVSARAVWVHQK